MSSLVLASCVREVTGAATAPDRPGLLNPVATARYRVVLTGFSSNTAISNSSIGVPVSFRSLIVSRVASRTGFTL